MLTNEFQRVVLLRKNLGEQYIKEKPPLPRGATKWIALGHFDEIYTYDLPLDDTRFFLNYIRQDKDKISIYNDDQVYYHPLYLIGNKQPLVSCDNILENSFRFIAIVRIHFATTRFQANQYERLCSIIKAILQPNEQDSPELFCRVYHATEFSDMVLDLRAQCFNTLQQFVLKTLRSNELIGKMYTYFGINTLFLHSNELCDQDDVISMLSVRFPCTTDHAHILTIKSLLSDYCPEFATKNMYSVNGIDDTLISCNGLPTNKLLEVYRTFLSTGVAPENVKSTTRVGFYIDTPLFRPKATDIENLCKNLIDLRKKLRRKLEQRGVTQRSWFHMIYESVNTLVRMSKTSVMDEIVYLLAPSMEAFMNNVLIASIDKINSHVKSYNEFAENYVVLIEQLMRLEGQLSQNPEYRPVICDIPVFMLEYTLAFLNKIVKLLQHGDNGGKPFEFLMMPCSCIEIAVKELFPAEGSLSGVVQLLIPDQDLYYPELVLRPLCHEVAHNVGEKYRCRDIRKEYYCHAIATLVVGELINSRNNRKAVELLADRFARKLLNYNYPTISQMAHILKQDVFFLTHKKDEQNMEYIADMGRFIHLYLSKIDSPNPITYVERHHMENIYNNILWRWKDIDKLFREIYADVCLLRILDLPVDEYIDSLLNIEWNNPQKSIAYDFFAIRIYVSLTTMGKEIPVFGSSAESAKVYTTILKIEDEISKGHDGEYKLSFSINTVVDLLNYARKCKSVMDICLKDCEEDIRGVQKMYKAFAYPQDYLGYDYIVEEIDTYRQEIIEAN